MKLPSKLRIGSTVYGVLPYVSERDVVGKTYTELGVMYVATKQRGRPRAADAISETFWHEVTHAILHDMGDPRWRDEKFVTAFSQRLADAIKSARFK